MAQPGEMDPDLVSSPGLQLQTEQGNSLCLPYCLVPGAGRLPVRADALLHQRALPGTQRGVHCPGGRLRRPHTPPDKCGGSPLCAAAPSGSPGRGDGGPPPSGRKSRGPDGGPGGNRPPHPLNRNNAEENYRSYRCSARDRGGPPRRRPCSAPEGPGPHRRCPEARGRARSRCAAPGQTGRRTTPPRPGTYRVFTRRPSTRMPSDSHLIRRTTVPDRPRCRFSRGVHPDPRQLRPHRQLQTAAHRGKQPGGKEEVDQQGEGASTMVVMKGEAMTAGSMPIFSATMGRVQPTTLAHSTVNTRVRGRPPGPP